MISHAYGADGAKFVINLVANRGAWDIRLMQILPESVAGWRPNMTPAEHRARDLARLRHVGVWEYFRPGTDTNGESQWNDAWEFVTLCAGDTDEEYFASYTPDMLEFRDRHAAAVREDIWYQLDPEGAV